MYRTDSKPPSTFKKRRKFTDKNLLFVYITMMEAVRGGSDRMTVTNRLAGVLTAFGHARTNAPGYAVMSQ